MVTDWYFILMVRVVFSHWYINVNQDNLYRHKIQYSVNEAMYTCEKTLMKDCYILWWPCVKKNPLIFNILIQCLSVKIISEDSI